MKRPEANQRQSERRRGESRWRDTAREMKRRGGETLLERWRNEAERQVERESRDSRDRRRPIVILDFFLQILTLDIFKIWAYLGGPCPFGFVHWTFGVSGHSPFGHKIFRADLGVTILVHIDLDMDHP